MDLNPYFFLDFIPIYFITILTFVTWIIIFYKLKNGPIKVNCWFCNRNAKIAKKSIDWWICPYCSQYNGFSEDGDYNYEIPEQYEIINENILKQKFYCLRKNVFRNQNSLCKQCNRKEELKLLKLRELEDSLDVYNDKQMAQFEINFEQKYPLCLKCQTIVTNVLHKQTLWLIQYKMLLFKQKPIKKFIENREKIQRFLRILLCILALITMYCKEASYFPLCGIFFQLATYLTKSPNKCQSEILSIIGWISLILIKVFSSSKMLKILNIYSNRDSETIETIHQYFVIILGIVIVLVNFKVKFYKAISNKFVAFKKLESPNKNIVTTHSHLSETAKLFNQQTNSIFYKESMKNFYSSINLTDTLETSSTSRTPISLKSTKFSQHSLKGNVMSASNYTSTKKSILVPEAENHFPTLLSNESYNLNDSLSSLNSLSLGTQERISTSDFPRIFKTRIYGTTPPDLFNKHQQYGYKRSILAPARLQSVTQTSWVAGGYWQSSIEVPVLSRSSSQSSGFGSVDSNGGPLRELSVHEFDQYSVASEHCCFARPESPLFSNSSNVMKRQNYLPKYSPINEMICNTDSLKYHLKDNTRFNGHTTIVTNPFWLSALLCGSLVFNIVVLYSILLY